MASKEYTDAAFNSVMNGVTKLLVLLPDIPFVNEQAVANSEIHSKRGQQLMHKLVEDAIAAGEAADARKAKES